LSLAVAVCPAVTFPTRGGDAPHPPFGHLLPAGGEKEVTALGTGLALGAVLPLGVAGVLVGAGAGLDADDRSSGRDRGWGLHITRTRPTLHLSAETLGRIP
jgi:hypothetical protein